MPTPPPSVRRLLAPPTATITADQAQNARGEWVPAIPLPLFSWPHRHRCECGRSFWTMAGYRGHYSLAHILYPEVQQ